MKKHKYSAQQLNEKYFNQIERQDIVTNLANALINKDIKQIL